MPNKIVLALDPGGTTGAAVGTLENGRMWVRSTQYKFEHQQLYDQLRLLNPDYLVCESFEYRRGTRGRDKLVLYPVELIGICHLWSQQHSKPLFLQQAMQGKRYYSDARLKEHKLYIAGKPHAMDAVRHLLDWFTFGWGYQFNDSGFEPESKRPR